MDIIKQENQILISARELHRELGMKRHFSIWINNCISNAFLSIGTDFTTQTLESSGGRPSTDYFLTKDSAIAIIIMSGGQNAKQLRDEVIRLFKMHDTGLAFTSTQIEALMDLSRSMTLVSIQENVEQRHFKIYNDKYTWYQHRAGILGYSTNDIINAMREVNRQHHSVRKSLIQLDANELIRTGVIDLMKALGKTDEYATNVGNLCKKIAEKMKLGNIIWNDTEENPIGLNKNQVDECNKLFDNFNVKQLT